MRCSRIVALSCALVPAALAIAQLECEVMYPPANLGRYKDTFCDPGLPVVPSPCKTLDANDTGVDGIWKPDRRPAFFIRLLEPASNPNEPYGQWAANPRGLKTWWHRPNADPTDSADNPEFQNGVPVQFEILKDQMKAAYELGFRRIVIQLPAGVAFGRKEYNASGVFTNYAPQDMSMNQWYAMPQWKQDWFKRADSPFQEFRDSHTDATVELYLGAPVQYTMCPQDLVVTLPALRQADFPGIPITPLIPLRIALLVAPGEVRQRWVVPAYPGHSSASDYDPRTETHRDRVYWNLQPWIASGIQGFWMDASSNNYASGSQSQRRWGHVQLSYNPFYRAQEIHFVGETIPCTGTNGGASVYDECAVSQAAWSGLEEAWDISPGVLRDWTFNRQNTEMHLLFQSGADADGHNTKVWQLARQCRQRGGVLTIFYEGQSNGMNGLYADLLQRWYSMGRFYRADFNGDGFVDNQDMSDFLEAFNDTNRVIKVYATVDIDGNGNVSEDDANLFYTMYSWSLSHPGERNPDYWFDFGAPNDL